jgi:hypothetical protein
MPSASNGCCSGGSNGYNSNGHQYGTIRRVASGCYCWDHFIFHHFEFFLTEYFFMFSSYTEKNTNWDVSALLVALGC